MKDKLIVILSLTTMFALGCAAASVLVPRAEAAPGQEECAAFYLGQPISLQKPEKVDATIAKQARVLPSGWHVVGGGSYPGASYVIAIACRIGE